MKITMMGRKGSGKTSFLGGICDTFIHRSVNDFRIRAQQMNDMHGEDFRTKRLLVGEIDKLSNRENGGFTIPTESTTCWRFEMVNKDESICTFEWVDYRGGAIDDAFIDSEGDDQDEITSHMATSDAVMIFVDAIALSYFSHDMDDAIHFSGAYKIFQYFDTMLETISKNDLIVLFVLSKADSDTLRPEFVDDGYSGLKALCGDVFKDLIRLGKNKGWRMAMLPTGVIGKEKVKTEIMDDIGHFGVNNTIITPGRVSPMNVDAALFYCISNVLDQRKQESAEERETIERTITDVMGKASFIGDFMCRINGDNTSKEVTGQLMMKRDLETENLIRIEHLLERFPHEKMSEVTEL